MYGTIESPAGSIPKGRKVPSPLRIQWRLLCPYYGSGELSFQSDPLFMARFGRQKERIVNALRSALERKDERSRAAGHKSEIAVPVHRARPDRIRAVLWGACALQFCSPR